MYRVAEAPKGDEIYNNNLFKTLFVSSNYKSNTKYLNLNNTVLHEIESESSQ